MSSAGGKKKKKKKKKKDKKSNQLGNKEVEEAKQAALAGAGFHATDAPGVPAWETPDDAKGQHSTPALDKRGGRRERERREFSRAMVAYRALAEGRHDRMLVVLLRAIRKQLCTTGGAGAELPAARVRLDTGAEYDADAWAAVHRRLTKDWGEYELNSRNDFRDTVRAVSGTQARLMGLRFPDSFQGGDRLITGHGVPIEMGGGSRSLELTPLSTTDAVSIGTYAGILQSNAERGTVVIPDHMMRSMGLSDGDRVAMRTVELHKVKGIRLRPARADWFKRIPIPQMPFLRTAMQRFSSMTRGQIITLRVTAADFESTPRYAEKIRDAGGVVEELFLAETIDPDEPMVKLWDGFFTNVKVDFLPAADAQEMVDRANAGTDAEAGAAAEQTDSDSATGAAGTAAVGTGDAYPRRVARVQWGQPSASAAPFSTDPTQAAEDQSAPSPTEVERYILGRTVQLLAEPPLSSGAAASGAGSSVSPVA